MLFTPNNISQVPMWRKYICVQEAAGDVDFDNQLLLNLLYIKYDGFNFRLLET